jgi:hypothetical protein
VGGSSSSTKHSSPKQQLHAGVLQVLQTLALTNSNRGNCSKSSSF